METDAVDRVRDAYDALSRSDVEPLVAMLDQHVHWRGYPRGRLKGRSAPF